MLRASAVFSCVVCLTTWGCNCGGQADLPDAARWPDAARLDASDSAFDLGITDAWVEDAGASDSETEDGAAFDIGPGDAEPADHGPGDGSQADATAFDAGCRECCHLPGATRCQGNAEQTCLSTSEGPRWDAPVRCSAGTYCSGGSCTPDPASPDPVAIAPRRRLHQPANVYHDNAFLWEGPELVQFGVEPNAIDEARVSMLRGQVLDRNGDPKEGVRVTAKWSAETGFTLTRADGRYDLAVNGGGRVTLVFEKLGHLTLHRSEVVPWNVDKAIEPVRLVPVDPAANPIVLGASDGIQVASGSTVDDGNGTSERTARVLVRAGTTGDAILPDGTKVPLSGTVTIRATEYTVGSGGRQSMPAELPPNVAYTYCSELSVDEAMAVGADEVVFNQPVVVLVDNFIGFPVGGIVPVGSYSRSLARWIPERNGTVIAVLAESDGRATLDVEGLGEAATLTELGALGIDDAELATWAQLYDPGQSVWRFAVTHFSPKDCNWNSRNLPADDPDSDWDDPYSPRSRHPGNVCRSDGCIVHSLEQTIQERIPLPGTPFSLSYSSDRVPGRVSRLEVPLTQDPVNASLHELEVFVEVAGRSIHQSYLAAPNSRFEWTWDGIDVYGRPVTGWTNAVVTKKNWYKNDVPPYVEPPEVFYSFATSPFIYRDLIIGNSYLRQLGSKAEFEVLLSNHDERPIGLGGWNLDVHHRLFPDVQKVMEGNGVSRDLAFGRVHVESLDCSRNVGIPSGVPCRITGPGLWGQPDGSAVVSADVGGAQVVAQVDREGTLRPLVGGGVNGQWQEGMLATDYRLGSGARNFASSPDGSIYYVQNNGIFRRSPDGRLFTIARAPGISGGYVPSDGLPADGARLDILGMVATPEGDLVYQDARRKVFRIDASGILHRVFDGIDSGGWGLAMCADGSIVTGSNAGYSLLRITPIGESIVLAGGNGSGYNPGPIAGREAKLLRAQGITCADDGTIYFTQGSGPGGLGHAIMQLDTSGVLRLHSGGRIDLPYQTPTAVHARSDGTLLIRGTADALLVASRNASMRELETGIETAVPSTSGDRVFVFDGVTGRHLRTIDTLSRAVLLTFQYDDEGRLSGVQDSWGNQTVIERSTDGTPEAIVAPGGQRTDLTLDAEGYLSRVGLLGGRTYEFATSPDGLIQEAIYPDGGRHMYGFDAEGALVELTRPDQSVTRYARTESNGRSEVVITGPGSRIDTHTVSFGRDGERSYSRTLDGVRVLSLESTKEKVTRLEADGTRIDISLEADPYLGELSPYPKSTVLTTPSGKSTTYTVHRAVTLDPSSSSLMTWSETVSSEAASASVVFDVAAQQLQYTSASGRVSTLSRDPDGRPTLLATPDLHPLSFTRNSRGQRTAVSFGDKRYEQSYDASGRASESRDPLLRTRSFTYDGADRVSSRSQSPSGWTVGMRYDGMNRLNGLDLPGGASYDFLFHPNGRLGELSMPLGAVRRYTYQDGRLALVRFPSGRQESYTRDNRGSLIRVSTPETVRVLEASASSFESLVSGMVHRADLTRDGDFVTQVEFSGTYGGRLKYTYGPRWEVTAVELDSSGDQSMTGYAYDQGLRLMQAGGFVFERSGPQGAVTLLHDSEAAIQMAYDAYGRLEHRSLDIGGVPKYQLELEYDLADRVTQKTETLEGVTTTWDFEYDALDRLSTVHRNGVLVEEYGYDARGNRLSRTYGQSAPESATFDLRDRLLTLGSTQYLSDDDGHWVHRGDNRFTYGPRGELLEAEVNGTTQAYGYDVLGRLVARSEPNGEAVFIYANVGSPWVPYAARAPGGPLMVFHQDDSGRVVAVDRAEERYYLATDQVGTVRAVFAVSGELVRRIDSDAFGRVLADSNPAFDVLVGFGGGLVDRTTGLVRMGLRDYDPESGRFTAPDPIGFHGGLNQFVYAGSDPQSRRDPSGMICVGGSFFATVGIGGQVCLDDEGFSACGEAGVGFGSSIEFSPFGDAKESWDIAVKAEAGANAFGAGAGAEFISSRCDGLISKFGLSAPGGIGLDREYKYNPLSGEWEEGDSNPKWNAADTGRQLMEKVKKSLEGGGNLGVSHSANAVFEACVAF